MKAICFCPYNKTLQNFESILNEPSLNPNQNEPNALLQEYFCPDTSGRMN